MISNDSVIKSILKGTCPRCHGGRMYVNQNPYAVSETMRMHGHCPDCGLKYKVEPNFFFGAMYVSYGLAVLAGLLTFVVSHFALGAGLRASFIAIFAVLVSLMPLIARISRNIYIAMFVRYRPELHRQV